MYRIIDKRGTGKTSRLFLIAKETGGVIVCANPSTLKKKAEYLGISDLKFVGYEEYFREYVGRKPILIDELESFLKFIDEDISGYSISIED